MVTCAEMILKINGEIFFSNVCKHKNSDKFLKNHKLNCLRFKIEKSKIAIIKKVKYRKKKKNCGIISNTLFRKSNLLESMEY